MQEKHISICQYAIPRYLSKSSLAKLHSNYKFPPAAFRSLTIVGLMHAPPPSELLQPLHLALLLVRARGARSHRAATKARVHLSVIYRHNNCHTQN